MNPLMHDYVAIDKGELKTGWDVRHNQALENPKGAEIPIVKLLEGLEEYVYQYANMFKDRVYDDYVLGTDGVQQIVVALRVLLTGELGRLDAGTIDRVLVEHLKLFGVAV